MLHYSQHLNLNNEVVIQYIAVYITLFKNRDKERTRVGGGGGGGLRERILLLF